MGGMDESKRMASTGPVIDWQRGTAGPDEASAVALRPQSLTVLKILHDNVGQFVSKKDLIAAVWPGVAVTDDSLVQCITEIRKAIGDANHTLIKTLPKRGYIYQPGRTDAQAGGAALDEPMVAPARTEHSRTLLLAACAVLVAGVAGVLLMPRNASKAVELPAIAVLPFNNLGYDAKGDKFAAMMTEDVITDLSHSKDFAVIARNSTDVYKDKAVDIRVVAKDLNAKYVLEGSVEALPGRVRATAQLINPATNSHIWSQRFEAQGDDVFTIEAEITSRIATSILAHDAAAANNERSLIRRKAPSQWSAYEAYQAGLEASHQMSGEAMPKAAALFQQALAIDPNFSRAHVALAWVNLLSFMLGGESPEVALPRMLEEAQTAVRLDPDDGEAHAVLAQAYSLIHDQGKMASETERALSLAPNNADILVITSIFLEQMGQSDRALVNVEKALRLNPNYPFFYNTTLYATYFYGGDFAKSYAFAKEAAKAAPVNGEFIAMNAAYLGKMDEAAAARKALLDVDPVWSVERLLTNFGMMQGAAELERLTTGATKAGLPVCMTKAQLAEMPGAVHLPQCDAERAKG